MGLGECRFIEVEVLSQVLDTLVGEEVVVIPPVKLLDQKAPRERK